MKKIAVITGASKGIGFAAAKEFIARGYQVCSISRSPCTLDGVTSLIIDLSAADADQRVQEQLCSKVDSGTELVLVHNAASLLKDTLGSIESAELTSVLHLNVVVPAMLNRILMPLMGRGSSIIYVGSTLSRKAVANSYSYVTSKHALLGMMRASCQDLAGSGIHTAMVMPGFTDTEMLRAHIGQDESIVSQLSAGVAMGRLVQPEEIATVIVTIALNPVLNGAEIDANLGQIER